MASRAGGAVHSINCGLCAGANDTCRGSDDEVRTHLALGKDAPFGPALQCFGAIVAISILSGLHHHYAWI